MFFCAVLIPNQLENSSNFKCLVISKRDGNCNSFKGAEQADFFGKAVCLDAIYNVMWSFDASSCELSYYNIILSESRSKSSVETTDSKILTDIKTIAPFGNKDEFDGYSLLSILTPELSLPMVSNCYVTRLQAAIHLLCCLDTLTIAQDLQMAAVKEEVEERQLVAGKQYSREDFQSVSRFESHGGGWGYSGHSIEAVRFMADTDILLGGFGLFGGRGEYTGKLKLLDIGPDGGEQEGDGELLAETEEVPYECGPRQKYPMLFEEPVPLQASSYILIIEVWCYDLSFLLSGSTLVRGLVPNKRAEQRLRLLRPSDGDHRGPGLVLLQVVQEVQQRH